MRPSPTRVAGAQPPARGVRILSTRAVTWELLRDVLPVVLATRLAFLGLTLLLPLWRAAIGVMMFPLCTYLALHRRLYPWLAVAFTAGLLVSTGRFLTGGWVA